MNVKRYPRLFLVFTAIMVTVCRCAFEYPSAVTMNLTNGKTVECLQYTDYLPTWSDPFSGQYYSYDCKIPCLDGTTVTARFEDRDIQDKITKNAKFDLTALQNQFCKKTTAAAEVTASSIPPLILPPPTPSPVLTEEITSCDLRAHYINMRMVESLPDLTDSKVAITINDAEVKCTIPSNNLTVYSCVLPNNMKFPADILATLDQVEVNNFTYDGSTCLNNGLGGSPSTEGDAPIPTLPPD